MSSHPCYFDARRIKSTDAELAVDLCVYGGTAAGVVAAVTAARRGKSVVLLNPAARVGGMTSGGLSYTDLGNAQAIGGMARRFYQDAGRHYGVSMSWTSEPHIAQRVLDDWLTEYDVPVHHHAFIDAAEREGRRIAAVRMLGGMCVKAALFIDASYEGDLMARCGVTYVTGREGNAKYGESRNGAQVHDKHQFDCRVDPYRTPSTPGSGALPGVNLAPPPPEGQGDALIQAYNFRVCMTRRPDIRVPFPRPEGYDPLDYELAARWLRCTRDELFTKFDAIRGDKTDTNNHGAVSTDFIGASYGWPEGTYQQREAIFQNHVRYQQGLHWFMANDPRVPAAIRERYAQWGLARDEFEHSGNWPHQLYIREARRMISDVVVTEHHCRGSRPVDNAVGMGAYQMDSHNCQRCVRDGAAINEGDVQYPLKAPYAIPCGAIVPRRGECENLLVPVCVSASHIAFGSIRMEPVFMILAESAAIAGCVALDESCPVQSVNAASLRRDLLDAGQVLECDITNEGDGNPGTMQPANLER
ncbi:MAG: FAD-dependent oxidoreductase [Phycisphaeraceae bacterium]|nr:FAD-dependent oxidoreductase [Phycisphaeraceae bacterium]